MFSAETELPIYFVTIKTIKFVLLIALAYIVHVSLIMQTKETQDRMRIKNLFAALTRIAAKLQAGSGEEAIYEILSTLGLAVGVDRTYLFDFQPLQNGDISASQRAEWVQVGNSRQIGNPDLQGFKMAEAGFGDWNEKMRLGIPVVALVKDLPKEQQFFLGDVQGIVSIVFMPVFLNGRLVGGMGYDDCTTERAWTNDEIDALRIAAGIVGVICYKPGADVSENAVPVF